MKKNDNFPDEHDQMDTNVGTITRRETYATSTSIFLTTKEMCGFEPIDD